MDALIAEARLETVAAPSLRGCRMAGKDEEEGPLDPHEYDPPKVAKRRTKTLKVSTQIPPKRRKEIAKALESHEQGRPDWDRVSGAKQHRMLGKRIKPGTIRQIKFPLLDVTMGDAWPTTVTVIHGRRPGPVVTIIGGVHGDEMVGPVACSLLTQQVFTNTDRNLDPDMMAGTLRIIPVLNPPGFERQNRYFPDGRDLNREFPGSADGSTTARVANNILSEIIIGSDYVIDLHTAARGRDNLPQVRADLAHPESNMIARAFGIEVILDSRGPKGSLRRECSNLDIGTLTYEGGGANLADHEAIKVALYGIMNVLRSLHVIHGNPSRPRFRLLASGSTWVRAEEGGLIDLYIGRGSFVQKDEVIGRIVDPINPGQSADLVSPERGIFICTANNPIVTAGTPVGHLLPIKRGLKAVKRGLDRKTSRLIVSGSKGEPVWREEVEVEEISIEGEWSGGGVDAEWQRDWLQSTGSEDMMEADSEEESD